MNVKKTLSIMLFLVITGSTKIVFYDIFLVEWQKIFSNSDSEQPDYKTLDYNRLLIGKKKTTLYSHFW